MWMGVGVTLEAFAFIQIWTCWCFFCLIMGLIKCMGLSNGASKVAIFPGDKWSWWWFGVVKSFNISKVYFLLLTIFFLYICFYFIWIINQTTRNNRSTLLHLIRGRPRENKVEKTYDCGRILIHQQYQVIIILAIFFNGYHLCPHYKI